MLNLLALLAGQATAPVTQLPIIEQSTCDEQCEQFIPDGLLGDFARTRALCSGPRFFVSRNAVGSDDRFAFIERSEIRWVSLNASSLPNAAEVRISGYEQTRHSDGASTADPVSVTMTLVYDEETDRLTLVRPNAATETFVRCPRAP